LAAAPKSNSVGKAMARARQLVNEGPSPSVPPHLRSTGYPGAEKLGHGSGYKYSHDYQGGVVSQQYFPDGIPPEVIYQPGETGDEGRISASMSEIDQVLGREGREGKVR
ncbi:MAG TPA: replication-associated recombination protein A, partial [Acidimicrobiia bacterium]